MNESTIDIGENYTFDGDEVMIVSVKEIGHLTVVEYYYTSDEEKTTHMEKYWDFIDLLD